MPALCGALRFGVRHGAACVGVCGPLMLVMAVVLHGSLLWMVVLAGVSAAVRLAPPEVRRSWSAPLALVLGWSATVVSALA